MSAVPHPTPEAEQAFDEYLRRVEEGAEVDFTRFCAERLHLADELRALKDDWDRLAGLVDELASGEYRPGERAAGEAGRGDGNGHPEPTPAGAAAAPSSVASVIDRLMHQGTSGRYAPRGELARGGMGVVLRMWDADLRRNLAMKVMLDKTDASGERDHAAQARQVGRFLEEAQITGQLDHPGIVPVHELGLDSKGHLYFTMRLVRGRDLGTILGLVRERREGWTVARALGVILKVCEALAYSHAKRVLHRDVKPSNVMVGRFGEVYVMDWGLAKVLGRKDLHDVRPAGGENETLAEVATDRHDDARGRPDSPLLTMDGSVVGTPAYMSPEQARGQVDKIDTRSDVYSVGALLYELLTGRPPYLDGETRLSPRAVLAAVREGPPRPLHQLARRVPAELAAICEKAMARRPDDRYDGMLAMAEDLRASLEGRVVAAYEAGPLARLRKWVRRNKLTAAVLATSLVALAWILLHLAETNAVLASRSTEAQQAHLAAEHEARAAETARAEAQRNLEAARVAADHAEASAGRARWSSYVASLAAADASLRAGRAGEARRHLDECPAELRGFEWGLLRLRSDPSLAVLRDHDGRVTAVAFDPTGRLLASGSWDGTVRVVHVESGAPAAVLAHDGEGVSSVAFSPDGRLLASGSHDGRVFVWDVARGTRLREVTLETELPAPVTAVAFAPDGNLLYAATEGRRLALLDPHGEGLLLLAGSHRSAVTDLDPSPDGLALASCSRDRTITIRDPRTGAPRAELFDEHGTPLAVAWAPGGERLAVGGEDGGVRLLEAASGRVLGNYPAHEGAVRSLVFCRGGEQLLTAGDDGTLRLWDPWTATSLAVLAGHEGPVLAAAVSVSGLHLASGSTDGTVRLWDPAWGDGAPTLAGHDDLVRSLAPSPDGLRLVETGWDGRLRLWELDSLRSLAVRDLPHSGTAVVAFSPDGRHVAAGAAGGSREGPHRIHLWNVARGDAFAPDPLSLDGHRAAVNALAFSPDGGLLASASDDRLVKFWHTGHGALLATLAGHDGWVGSLAFHPTRAVLVSGGTDETLRLWSVPEGIELSRVEGLGGGVGPLAFSPDGTRLAAGCADGSLRLLDAASLAPLVLLAGHPDDVLALTFHPDGTRLASSGADGSLRLWDVLTGDALLTLETNERSPSLAFTPDGGRLCAALGDQVAVFETRPPAATFPLRRGWAEVAPAGQELFDRLLAELVDPRAVLLHLEDDRELDDVVRAEALRLARNFGTDPYRLAESAWALVLDEHAPESTSRRALQLARAADRMAPGKARLLGVLGLARYRVGDWQGALHAGERARKLNLGGEQRSHPEQWDLLVLSMAYRRLNSPNLARTYLEEALALGADASDPVTLALEREARLP